MNVLNIGLEDTPDIDKEEMKLKLTIKSRVNSNTSRNLCKVA